jgi:hypothetical protein
MIYEKIQLEASERIVSVVHRHWFYLFKQGIFILVVVIAPLFCILLSKALLVDFSTTFLNQYFAEIIFVYSFWLLVCWMILMAIWTNYYLDIWCITNLRIIKINQRSFFNRRTGSFRLEKLQDITVEVNGFIATLFDFGTIKAETASADMDDFTGTFLPKPQEIKALILKQADRIMREGI